MTTLRGTVLVCTLTVGVASNAGAQPSSSSTSTEAYTAATTTFMGDTGLWFVPTAEVLAHGKWSGSGYRRGTNYVQGFTNVGDFAGTFAVGVGNRAELFGSFLFDTRVDRDIRPLFINDPEVGGIVDRYPRVADGWTGNNVGDFLRGAKINLLSKFRDNPMELAVRAMVKAPTGDVEKGTGTGKADVGFDLIA